MEPQFVELATSTQNRGVAAVFLFPPTEQAPEMTEQTKSSIFPF